ncbi:NUDIX hydrolase [Virgisporangium aurantiacum]|uniref:NUDIX hydrolase n=2 Tax=Virgisporangium aurantiacum TaxID=175570 RepID=A0A8J3ZJW5_9ACTN|nr:NUDIX hydrolase [Virgisporangium aurantiacum]
MVEPEGAPLYERDPEAWQAYLAEGNAKQPRKRVSADVIVCDSAGRILLVNPSYKPDWDVPGGMVEANEPPHAAARRELREELGLDVQVRQLLVIDWVSPHGQWDDLLSMVFDSAPISDEQISSIQFDDTEISAFELCDRDQVEARLRPYVWRRVLAALEAKESGIPSYLADGRRL